MTASELGKLENGVVNTPQEQPQNSESSEQTPNHSAQLQNSESPDHAPNHSAQPQNPESPEHTPTYSAQLQNSESPEQTPSHSAQLQNSERSDRLPTLSEQPQTSGFSEQAEVAAQQTEFPAQQTEVSSQPPKYQGIDEAGSAQDPQEGLMTVVEHLDELRWRIIRSVGYIAVSLIGMLFVTKDILVFLEKPAGNITFQALSLEEPVLVYIKVAFYAALIAASPFILFEVARFISPGLTRKERTIMAPIVVGSPLLFIAGAAFAYFLLLPPMLHFFGSFGVGVSPINQRLDFYISLVSSIMLYLGLCFQLPIVIFALSFTGIVNSRMLIAIWKYAVAGITVIAAVVTPDPTAMSMLMVMAALIGLYFLSILLLKIFGR
ncbi:MAG TPA: twin-arginine translocase subunit TatC [Drouetiella sp.]